MKQPYYKFWASYFNNLNNPVLKLESFTPDIVIVNEKNITDAIIELKFPKNYWFYSRDKSKNITTDEAISSNTVWLEDKNIKSHFKAPIHILKNDRKVWTEFDEGVIAIDVLRLINFKNHNGKRYVCFSFPKDTYDSNKINDVFVEIKKKYDAITVYKGRFDYWEFPKNISINFLFYNLNNDDLSASNQCEFIKGDHLDSVFAEILISPPCNLLHQALLPTIPTLKKAAPRTAKSP